MALPEHQAAVDRALKAGDQLEAIFHRMGSAANPRGMVVSAYREARKALDLTSARRTRETLSYLRDSLQASAQGLLEQSARLGQNLAQQDAAAYADLADLQPPDSGGVIDDALAAWMATFDQQYAAIMALAANDLAAEAEILGDGASAGVLNPLPFIVAGTRWTGAVFQGTWSSSTQQTTQTAVNVFVKQAVAAIDERTTPCCLGVHGQVAPIDGLFTTDRPPAYAAKQQQPPFHGYCRTALALVRAEDAEDALSQQMRDAADAEISAQAMTGRKVEIHPAHARSRR